MLLRTTTNDSIHADLSQLLAKPLMNLDPITLSPSHTLRLGELEIEDIGERFAMP